MKLWAILTLGVVLRCIVSVPLVRIQQGEVISAKQKHREEPNHLDNDFMQKMQKQYLSTVRMGIMGGLDHGSSTDRNRGATTDPAVRNECLNWDWMAQRHTDSCIMKWDANERLLRVEDLYSKIRSQGIPGDLMECGVWRGGLTIYMKALLRAFGDETDRHVWVADSFTGVPNAVQQEQDFSRAIAEADEPLPSQESANEALPDQTGPPSFFTALARSFKQWIFSSSNPHYAKRDGEPVHPALQGYSMEEMQDMDFKQWGGKVTEPGLDGQMVAKNYLTVEQQLVEDNFRRFDLLDDGVRFLPGYFSKTLPEASSHGVKQIALLRVDADLYTSTKDVLDNLYRFVSPGGYIIFDDYPLPQSRFAIQEFFAKNKLDLSLLKTDRLTDEVEGGKGNDFPGINANAYFQKPLQP